jgi:hypothetical protein
MSRAVFEHHYQEQLLNTLKFEQHCLRGQVQDTQKKIRIPLLGFVFKEHSFDNVKWFMGWPGLQVTLPFQGSGG